VKNSTDNPWEIEHQCPQCGAPVTLKETDRLFSCSFCRVRLCLTTETTFRYVLPAPASIAPERLFYLPYWRFKGLQFSCHDLNIEHSLLDGTCLAFTYPGAPGSLGIRPQVTSLRFASIETGTHPQFMEPYWSVNEAVRKIGEGLASVSKTDGDHKIFFKNFVGETVSLVYAPYFLQDGRLYDGLLQRDLGPAPVLNRESPPVNERGVAWAYTFLPALCPDCGWDLQGDRNSVVFVCNNCCSAWRLAGQGLGKTAFSIIPAPEDQACFLPFWRIRVRSEGLHLHSYADLIRLANLPKIIQPGWEQEDLYCWLPAFKVQGNLFLRLGKSLSLFPPEEPLVEDQPASSPLSPVTLTISEALKGLKITIANLAAAKNKIWPLLNELSIQADLVQLVYLPFREQGEELIETRLGLSIMKNALKYGINL
jgi:hypothetical protein